MTQSIGVSGRVVLAGQRISHQDFQHILGTTVQTHNSHVRDGEPVATIDGHGLDGSVLDVQVGDGRAGQVVGVEELGLGLAAVAALAVPPPGAVGVEVRARGALDRDLLALDLEERAVPLFVAPGRLALEDDLSWCELLF